MIDWQRLDPKFWLQNYPTCREWDKILNEALDRHEPIQVTEYSVRLGPLEVWVSSWPYCYGHCERPFYKALPMVPTRKRLRKIVSVMQRNPLDDIRDLLGENK